MVTSFLPQRSEGMRMNADAAQEEDVVMKDDGSEMNGRPCACAAIHRSQTGDHLGRRCIPAEEAALIDDAGTSL
jgi:hypothetical protein